MKALDAVPYYERQWGDWLVRNMINTKLKLGLGVLKNGKSKNWQAELAQELHKPVKRYFTQRRVVVNHIDEIWAADLVDMQKFSKWNKGYKHLLMVIDVFNKYAWIKPLKDKTGEIVTEAFKSIFKEGKRLKYLWVNNGKEFYNKHLKDLLDKHSITIYWTENEEKSGVVERWNRTIKQRMWKEFTVQGNTQYFDILPQSLTKYSNTKHSSTEMMSEEANKKKNKGTVYLKMFGDMETATKSKFKVGDKVRYQNTRERQLTKDILQIKQKRCFS